MSPLSEAMADVIRPLGRDEERRAVEVALGRVPAGRPRVYGVELRIEKRRGRVPDRWVSVLLADLDDYVPREVVVDADGEVVTIEDRADVVPPYTAEEIGDATAIARGESEVGDLVNRWAVKTAVSYPSERKPRPACRGVPSRRGTGLEALSSNMAVSVGSVTLYRPEPTGG